LEISFFSEDTNFHLPNSEVVADWIHSSVLAEQFSLQSLNIVFCSDDYLLEVNKTYLQHDYYTDIITFDNSESDSVIEGDIFISIDRVRENATLFSVPFFDELCRVIIHGILHLMNYDDHSDVDRSVIRMKEDHYLALRTFSS
jgi:probable rRNA maturation factor